VVDYGEDGVVSDSLHTRCRRFSGSQKISFLVLAKSASPVLPPVCPPCAVEAQSFGPITQSSFLGQLGINFRVEALMENATEEQAEALRLSYWRLVGEGNPLGGRGRGR